MQKPNLKRLQTNLRREVEENPLTAIGVAAGALVAVSKFLDAASSVQSKRAYAKRMNRKK